MERFKEDEILLNVREAMEYLRVSRSTIYRLIKKGKLKGHKVGKKVGLLQTGSEGFPGAERVPS